MVHLDDDVDAFACAEEDGIDVCGVGTGLPSRAMTFILWPGSAMRRFSMALALRKWMSRRWPSRTRIGFAGAERLVVDGVGHGADLEAVGVGVQDGGFSSSGPLWVSSSSSSMVPVKNGSQSRRARKSSWS